MGKCYKLSEILFRDSEGVYRNLSNLSLADLDDVITLIRDGYIEITSEGDDKGLIMPNQLSIGTRFNPAELVVGDGDSYPVPIAFHFDYANLIGDTITGATDVTSIFQSDSLSTLGLFNGVTQGKCLLIGSDKPYGGVKCKVDTAGDIDIDSIKGEYLYDSGIWIEAKYMVTDANEPFNRRGSKLATIDSISEQWRFGFDPDFIPTPWNQVTLTINDIPYTRYWGLLRIVNPITIDPLIQQFKCHTNRWECNSQGITEYFGRSRYPRTLTEGLSDVINNALGSPSNENVVYSSTVSANYKDNEFRDGFDDGFIIPQTIVESLDTSIPLLIDLSFYVKGATGGVIDFLVDRYEIQNDFEYNTEHIPIPSLNSYNSPALKEGLRQTVRFKVSIDNIISGGVLLHIRRRGDSAIDTLSHNVVITNIHIVGHFWR